jgi:hypothetical protein
MQTYPFQNFPTTPLASSFGEFGDVCWNAHTARKSVCANVVAYALISSGSTSKNFNAWAPKNGSGVRGGSAWIVADEPGVGEVFCTSFVKETKFEKQTLYPVSIMPCQRKKYSDLH